MKKYLAKLLLALILTACLTPTAFAMQKISSFKPTEPVMPITSVKKGMKGYLKTVISGKTITKHNISVVGVLKRKTAPHNLVLIKIEDKKLLQEGGVAAGMSGSPVYVGGKLIGAFAYSWSFADKSLGLVTPISEMCSSMNWQEFIPTFIKTKPVDDKDFMMADNHSPKKTMIELSDKKEEEIPDRDVPPPVLIEDFEEIQENTIRPPFLLMEDDFSYDIQQLKNAKLIPLSFVLQSDGLREQSIRKLEDKLNTTIVPLAATSESDNGVDTKKRLNPGASMGVALAWGDISLGGIGTLTAVDKNGRFLAFGHPMLNRGAVAVPFTESEVIRVIPNLKQAFKLGSIGPIIGMVTQDRPEAIGGHFGKLPPAVSYSVLFHDLDNDRTKAKRFKTIVDPFLSPEIGEEGILSILENEWARKGEGTLMLRYKVKGGGLKEPWERKDIFFSHENALEPIEKNMKLLTEIFALNKFEEINPLGIEVEALLTRDPRVAFIEKLEIIDEKEFYEPGDIVKLKVTIHPWRKEPLEKKITLRVPKKAVGICEIDVRAGGIEPQKEEAVLLGLSQITSLESLLEELSVQETNNMLIAEIGGPEMPEEKQKKKHESTLGKMDKHRGDKEKDEDKKEIKTEDEDSEKSKTKLPDFLTETRLLSEIQKERLEEGTLRMLDTNYYMDGILRKFIKIKKSDANEFEKQFMELLEMMIKEEKKAADKKKNSSEPTAQYFRNSTRGLLEKK